MHRVVVLSLLSLVIFAGDVSAQVALTGGRKVKFQDKASSDGDKASFVFSNDPALTVTSPLCPAVTTLQFSSSAEVSARYSLPCENWLERGKGYQYRDKFGVTGGLQKLTYQPGKLVGKLKNALTPKLHGPVTHIAVRFSVEAEAFCGRFENITRNDVDKLSAKKPSVVCVEVCGDGIVDPAEPCDDGNLIEGDGCDTNCTLSACGNGILSAGEDCDDGNFDAGDGCRANCTIEACGDGIVDPGEDCDDGNLDAGDCCDALCVAEDGSPCSDTDACTLSDICVGSVCTGVPTQPWINEYDYDDFTLGGVTDIDEFIEIAGPAGTDLSGYQVIAVEGNNTCVGTVFVGVGNGEANFSAVIPPGSVLADDTGTGVGLFVVCFTSSSSSHEVAGECDVVLPAPSVDSNLRNGDLINITPADCPDGILLLDPANNLADAISYEGIVPNVGNYGPYFHVTPYNGGQDQGFKSRVSFEKTTGVLRATSASEWRLTGGCTTAFLDDDDCVQFSDTPGLPNVDQILTCSELFCGDGLTTGAEECDEGLGNSDAPDATCRTDCTAQACGDGILDSGLGEECEIDADCTPGDLCGGVGGCGCVTPQTLGPLSFTVVPGPSELAPVDDGESSWLRTFILASIINATQGDFNEGPALLSGGTTDANGIADLTLSAPFYIGAQIPAAGGTGRACFYLEQDPSETGFIDCDGGSAADVTMTMDSHGAGANDPPVLSVGLGSDAGPGTAVIRVLITGALTTDLVTLCPDADYSGSSPVPTAFTTAAASSTILNPLQGGTDTSVALAGQPFDCGNWTTDSGASIVLPNVNPDLAIPILGPHDLAQAFRLNDD